MEIEKLFAGIAVIVDDEINQQDSSICNIRSLIEEKNIPVLSYEDIPKVEIIDAFTNVSFIVLDWEYIHNPIADVSMEERFLVPPTLHEDKEEELLNFIKEIMAKLFVPIFIFTARAPEE